MEVLGSFWHVAFTFEMLTHKPNDKDKEKKPRNEWQSSFGLTKKTLLFYYSQNQKFLNDEYLFWGFFLFISARFFVFEATINTPSFPRPQFQILWRKWKEMEKCLFSSYFTFNWIIIWISMSWMEMKIGGEGKRVVLWWCCSNRFFQLHIRFRENSEDFWRNNWELSGKEMFRESLLVI